MGEIDLDGFPKCDSVALCCPEDAHKLALILNEMTEEIQRLRQRCERIENHLWEKFGELP